MSSAEPAARREPPVNLRQLGRLRILQSLADGGELSRPELTRLTGLSRATVSSVVYDLIGEGLVREHPPVLTGAKLGRPPQTLSLQPATAFAIGADIGHDHVRTILCNVAGDCIWDAGVGIDVDESAAGALDAVITLVDRGLRETGTPRAAVVGLGVGIACPVERRTGELRAEGIMPNWAGRRPGAELAERTGLAVQVINAANACVLAERRFGAARTWDDVVFVRLSAGIGAGIVCDGRMLLGHEGLAGEVGHVIVEANGAVCRCGNRGCLETVATPAAITELLSRSWGREVSTADLLGLVAARDRGAIRAVEDAGDAVGRALAASVMTLNPRLVLVGGELAAAGDALLDPMRRALRRNTVGLHHGELEISLGTLGDAAGVRGAAALILADAPQHLSAHVAGA